MKTSLNSMHHQAVDWLRELGFYKEEIAILTQRLEDVSRANTVADVLQQIESYQNRFIILQERLDNLQHEVHLINDAINRAAGEHPDHTHHRTVESDDRLKNAIEALIKDIISMRFQFNEFLRKTL